jgi:hypothetical protein
MVRMSLRRALAVWLLIVVLESVSGTLRELVLAPAVGDLRARQVGVAVGSLLVLAVAWSTVRWIGCRTLAGQLGVGGLWVVLTVAFEVGLGLALGRSVERLLADYDPTQGGFLGLGLLVMLLAPLLAARLREPRPEQVP